jgi:hypothetical protein
MVEAKVKKCWACGRTDFESWDELAKHMTGTKDTAHKKNKSGIKWAKKYIHRDAIKKLRSIGQNKEPEPRLKLTPEQLEAKHEAKYTLSGQTKYVKVICPNIKCKSRLRERYDFVDIEHVISPDAAKTNGILEKLCEECK